MVQNQLLTRDIKDPKVIEAMAKIPRHLFVPENVRDEAYEDWPLPIGAGQTISQPYMVAAMTQELRLKGNEKVLEIGTGSGYQTAVLAYITREVYTVEVIPELLEKAKEVLKRLGFNNIKFKIGDGSLGWPEFAPYDAILVTAAAPDIPPPLISQLKKNGRMVIPLGDYFGQDLVLVEKLENGKIRTTRLFPCVFVPLKGKYGFK